MHAACDQYSKVALVGPQYSSSIRVRATGPRRAKVTSSWDRASTEIVSSCTARRRPSMVAGPPRIRGPRSDWAARAILRASWALREIAAPGTGTSPVPASGKIRAFEREAERLCSSRKWAWSSRHVPPVSGEGAELTASRASARSVGAAFGRS